jgi:hypothetical protein
VPIFNLLFFLFIFFAANLIAGCSAAAAAWRSARQQRQARYGSQ